MIEFVYTWVPRLSVCKSFFHFLFMPKQKSHSGAKKRVRVTGSGKIMMNRAGRNHLLQQKSKRQKRLPSGKLTHKGEYKKLRSLLPNLL